MALGSAGQGGAGSGGANKGSASEKGGNGGCSTQTHVEYRADTNFSSDVHRRH